MLILPLMLASSTKHTVYEHKSSFSYCRIAHTYISRPYREPWYSSRLPYLVYQSEDVAPTQFVEEFYLAFRLLKFA